MLITDLSSELLNSEFLLNISRSLRFIILLLFIRVNIFNFHIIRKFQFSRFFFAFAVILFLYVFTDKDFLEGLWLYSKTLFWILGINVLFVLGYKNKLSFNDFIIVVKKVVFIAFTFTLIFFATGYIKEDYNVASYLVLFMFPIVLQSTLGYRKNKLLITIAALAILITLKRGAILAFVLGNLVYFFGILRIDFSVKKLAAGILLFLVLITSGLFVFNQQKNDIEGRFSEEQFDVSNEQAGSGRIGLYTNLTEAWFYSDNRLFGFGNQEDSRRNRNRIHAHSDIFGFLYNHGIVGIILILFLYVKILKFYVYYRKYDKKNTPIILALLIILLLVNFYSGMFRTTDAIYFFALLPYLQLKRDAIKQSIYFNKST
ncbi:O-antigen ligase family protein [Bizionia sediminis]|uniref:O-antigen ligase family protein n=1 Tax=Bizionia sediminis TaxID=1737064 RepID=A0ABW5KVJ6_9FLAO